MPRSDHGQILLFPHDNTFTDVFIQIHASLDNFTEVCYQKKGEFHSEAYEGTYKGHQQFLNNLKEEIPDVFHELMAGLYTEVAYVLNLTVYLTSY